MLARELHALHLAASHRSTSRHSVRAIVVQIGLRLLLVLVFRLREVKEFGRIFVVPPEANVVVQLGL